MSIAFLGIRLEVADDGEKPFGFDFIAKGLKGQEEKYKVHRSSYASVASSCEDSIPPTPDESREVTLADYRGLRELHDIAVETYESQYFTMTDQEPVEPRPLQTVSEGLRDAGSMSSQAGSQASSDKSTATVVAVEELHVPDTESPRAADTRIADTRDADTRKRPGVSGANTSAAGGSHGDDLLKRHSFSREGSAKSDASSDSLPPSKKMTRFKPIHVAESSAEDRGPFPPGARPKSQSPILHPGSPTLHFYSGNPTVEKVKGILHIYKDHHMINLSEEDATRSELVCMLAVPARFTIHDLLKFNGPCLKGIEFMRIIRDASPNQYMVLVKFRTQKLADEYYTTYNNTAYNSIESDICHLVYVSKVEVLKESENACYPIPGVTELPNCPVCLERMDESVDGILTILCNHAFHINCLEQWGDTSCPVCRYCQTPEETVDSRCMKCGSQESLWICLICGNIGCGRYVGLHAFRHFQETQHTYAMELGNNKVWDYVGDNYVHRLIQNKSDGKLVQVDEGGNPVHDEKVDSLNLEYTYLLTNQLESQRLYFEERMTEIEQEALDRVQDLEKENHEYRETCHRLERGLTESNKDKQLLDKKTAHLHQRLKKALHDLQEEREMNKSLLENQSDWQKKVTSLECQMKTFTSTKDKEIEDLREQLRDVMFYVEAQQKLSSATEVTQEELQEGRVVVGAAASQPRKSRKKPR